MTEEERRERLLRMGLDPSQYRYVTNEEAAYEDTTRLSTVGTGLKQAIGPTAGALGGAKLGMMGGAAFGPIGAGVGGLVGGVIGGFAGAFGQGAIEEAVLDDAEEQALALERQAAAQKYPYTSFFAQTAPSLGFVRPSPTLLKAIPGALKNAPLRTQTALQKQALTGLGIGSGLEAGVEAGSQALMGEELDYGRIGLAGLVGGALQQPTRLGKKIYGDTPRPLTDEEALAVLPTKREEILSRAEKALEEEKLKTEARLAADDKATSEAEASRRDETTATEDLEATKRLKDDKANVEIALEKAQRNRQLLEKQTESLRETYGSDHKLVQQAQRKAMDALQDEMTVMERVKELNDQRKAQRDEAKRQEAEVEEIANRHNQRQQALTGKALRIPPSEQLLKDAKGLSERLGMGWRRAVIEATDRYNAETTRGVYKLPTHEILLNEKLDNPDTPFHEYLHGLWQVLKRGDDPKHRGLLEFFETDLFAESKMRNALESDTDKRIWSEEQIVERAGKMLQKRMTDAPAGVMAKLGKWFDDYKLERDARKGFVPKKGDTSDKHLERLADWLAMRGERQPVLQPQQLELFLTQLPVRFAGDGLDSPTAGGERYSKDSGGTADPNEPPLTFEQQAEEMRKIREALEAENPSLKNPDGKPTDAARAFAKIRQDHLRLQEAKAEQVTEGLKIAATYDEKFRKRYTKKVRDKMVSRIKSGTFSIEQAQKALLRFANKPFANDMKGEDIAKVINSLEMYHGSPAAKTILAEGFKGEELSPGGLAGRGIYITPDKDKSVSYGEPISIRTNFRSLLDLGRSQVDIESFYNDYTTKATQLGYTISEERNAIIEIAFNEARNNPESSMPVNALEGLIDGINPATALQNFNPERGIAPTPVDIRNRILNEMGYDGLTYVFDGVREVVAFREPFQKANGQLQEYYTDQRLQKVDSEKLLEDMNDYQLTSATDHFSSNPAVLTQFGIRSIVDSVRIVGQTVEEKAIANRVADALDATARDSRELQGRFIEQFLMHQGEVKLSQRDAELVQIYMVHRRRKLPVPSEAQAAYDAPDSKVRYYVDYFSKDYTKARDLQLGEGMKVYSPSEGDYVTAGRDVDYVPETFSLLKRRELQGDFGLVKQQAAKQELLEYWKEVRGDDKAITDADLEVALNKYISKSVDFDSDLGSTKFGAIRKVQGLGLPKTLDDKGRLLWIEPSAVNNYTRYFKRFADDFAFYKNVENDAVVRAALGVPHEGKHAATLKDSPFTTRTKTEIIEGKEIQLNAGMTSHPAVQNFMKGYLGYYDGSELIGRTANRLVVSHWLGFMSGIRDLFTSYTLALPYMGWNNASALVKSFTDVRKSWVRSHAKGVNKTKSNRIEFGLETHTKLLNGLDKWSDLATKYSGRNVLERSTRALQFGLGRALVLQNIGAADTDRLAMRTLETLGRMSGVDYRTLRRHADKADSYKLSDAEFDNMLDDMAAGWVEINQGTYDVRGVPSWTLFGAPSLFTSLSRWTVEKTTRMDRDILGPLFNEGDIRPLVKSTLGAVVTGGALTYISQFIYNKLQGAPTLEEALKAENNDEARYAVVNMLNQTGYFGLVSALLNDWARFEQGYNPDLPGGFVFPALDFFSQTMMDPMADAVRAIEEGAPVIETYGKALNDVMLRATQTYRIISQQAFQREEMDKANMRRNYRVFRRLEGFTDATVSPEMGNKYMRPDTREFKEAETVEEMVQTIPGALREQIDRAQGRPDKLKSYVQGLYTTSDKTMPSVKTVEGVKEFMRYRDFMIKMGRGKDWQRTFNEWARKQAMSPTRKALVKGYVELQIARSQQ